MRKHVLGIDDHALPEHSPDPMIAVDEKTKE